MAKNTAKGKNIIVLSDGTGNSSAKLLKTNVWRTYETLDLSNPKKQIACYDDGVGNSPFMPLALLGGAIGLGLSRNVRELYAYICRNYQEGDRIYGFGFSRGAFTIRILAGFIAKVGILKRSAYTDESDLQKKTRLLYRAYRKRASGDGLTPLLALVFRAVRDSFPGQALPADFHSEKNFHLNAEIEFLGLWDTVDAYGFPIDEMTVGWDRFVWPLSMRNRDLSSKVKKAAHALSLDDERNSFHPLLWNETGDSSGTATVAPMRQDAEAGHIKEERLSQVWFVGMHADVGGGYADDFLSYIPLNWVLAQTGPHVIFNKLKRVEYAKAARTIGVIHDSRKGLASYYRLLPRKLKKLIDTRRASIRLSPRYMPKFSVDNVVEVARPKIHHSVFDRIAVKGAGYAPIVLPEKYAVVMPNDAILNLGQNTFETAAKAKTRSMAQERVWDIVWCRRIAYFSTLAVTACLVLLPWIHSIPGLKDMWPLSLTTKGEKCVDSLLCFVAGVPKLLGAFLPAFANRWVDTFSANPGVFAGLAGAVAGLMFLGTWLDRRIDASMAALWHNTHMPRAGYSALYSVRESRAYQLTLRFLKKHLLPLGFGMAALLGILVIAVSGASRVVFSFWDAKGIYCVPTGKTGPITKFYSGTPSFNPKNPCWASGLIAEKGATYRVVLNIAASKENWKDNTIPADLQGNLGSHGFVKAIFAWPAKRYVWENYYKPVARIRTQEKGATGQDEYVLNPTFLSSLGSSKLRRDGTTGIEYDCLVSDFTAQSSGELFLFVNDAIIYFKPNGWVPTYENNSGTAEVFVKRIAVSGEPFALPPGMKDTSACEEFVSSR